MLNLMAAGWRRTRPLIKLQRTAKSRSVGGEAALDQPLRFGRMTCRLREGEGEGEGEDEDGDRGGDTRAGSIWVWVCLMQIDDDTR